MLYIYDRTSAYDSPYVRTRWNKTLSTRALAMTGETRLAETSTKSIDGARARAHRYMMTTALKFARASCTSDCLDDAQGLPVLRGVATARGVAVHGVWRTPRGRTDPASAARPGA